jgi:catechol 2,3-dioxygenase-like lactoylglutathione lyase family enzyme
MHADGAAEYGGHGQPGATAAPFDGFGFSHMVLEVADLDRSEAWYRDVLALEPMGRNLLAEPGPHAVLRMNTGQLVVLLQVESPDPIRENTSSIHHAFYLTYDQYREAQARFSAAGYDISDTREQFRAKGEHSMDIFDPDGHRWQVQAFSEEQHAVIKPGVGVVDCGPAAQYSVGSVTTFREGNFFLVREAGGFLALSRWCRHANGLVAYQREHWRFYCAFHGATYDQTGCHTGHLPNVGALRLNPVTITADGRVRVDTDVVIERDNAAPPPLVPAPEVLQVSSGAG